MLLFFQSLLAVQYFSRRTLAWVEQVKENPDPSQMEAFSELIAKIYQYPLAHPEDSLQVIESEVIPRMALECGIILDEETDDGEIAASSKNAKSSSKKRSKASGRREVSKAKKKA
jgi:hypothetical protein